MDPIGQTVLGRFSLLVSFSFHFSALQHQGSVSRKTIFPWMGRAMVLEWFKCITSIVLYYYYYISSTLDYQTLDPRCWGPLFYRSTLVFSPAVFLISWGRGHLAASGFVSLTEHIYQRKDSEWSCVGPLSTSAPITEARLEQLQLQLYVHL